MAAISRAAAGKAGIVLAAIGLLLIGLGQDVAGNILAARLDAFVPAGWQWAAALTGSALLLGGLGLWRQTHRKGKTS